jgi:hypothetical protein
LVHFSSTAAVNGCSDTRMGLVRAPKIF